MKGKIFVLAQALVLLAGSAVAADKDVVVLDKSRAFVARSTNSQRFVDYIDLNGGQERLPLTFTFYNGTDTAPGFKWLRVSIAGRPYFTEKDFKGGKTMVIDMSGDLGGGSSQIQILGGGEPGATVSWVLTTPQPVLNSVKPDKSPNGKTVTLSGAYFSPNAGDNVVTLGNKAVSVSKSTRSTIDFQVPADVEAGKQSVGVSVLGLAAAKRVELTITPKPKVASLDLFSGAPGQTLTISGENFAASASENKVTIGGQQAEISSASKTSIVCTIPLALDAVNPSWGLPVIVEVAGIKSNDDVTFNVQMRNIPEGEVSPGFPGGDH